jgi:hypothetical protein
MMRRDTRISQDTIERTPGNANLGNLDPQGISAAVCDHFQAESKRRFCGTGINENKFDFLTFIKDIQVSLPSDSQRRANLSVVKKAMGCNHGENNRDNTKELSLQMYGSLNIYKEYYIAGKQKLYVNGVAQNAAALNRLRYAMIAPDPAAVAGTPQAGGALVGVAAWAHRSPRELHLALT